MSSHDNGSHKPGKRDQSTNANANSGSPHAATPLDEVPEDYNYSIQCFLDQPQTGRERPPLGFREPESEEEAKARAQAHIDAVDAVLGPNNNLPRN